MTPLSLVHLAVAMRVKQKQYFKSRSRVDLLECKALEKQFDEAAEQLMKEQG